MSLEDKIFAGFNDKIKKGIKAFEDETGFKFEDMVELVAKREPQTQESRTVARLKEGYKLMLIPFMRGGHTFAVILEDGYLKAYLYMDEHALRRLREAINTRREMDVHNFSEYFKKYEGASTSVMMFTGQLTKYLKDIDIVELGE